MGVSANDDLKRIFGERPLILGTKSATPLKASHLGVFRRLIALSSPRECCRRCGETSGDGEDRRSHLLNVLI